MKFKVSMILAATMLVGMSNAMIADPATTNQMKRMIRAIEMSRTPAHKQPAICGWLDMVDDFLPSWKIFIKLLSHIYPSKIDFLKIFSRITVVSG